MCTGNEFNTPDNIKINHYIGLKKYLFQIGDALKKWVMNFLLPDSLQIKDFEKTPVLGTDTGTWLHLFSVQT